MEDPGQTESRKTKQRLNRNDKRTCVSHNEAICFGWTLRNLVAHVAVVR